MLQITDSTARDRLDFYCAVFAARPTQVDVTLADGATIAAQTYVSEQKDVRFALTGMAQADAVHLRMAGEIMMSFNHLSVEYVADRLAGIFRRATSYVATQSMPADPERDMSRDVVIKARQQPYMNFFTVEENDLRFRRYDGQLSEVINRGALHVGQVVAVLPYDPVRDCVLLVEQFRAAVFMSGNAAPWMWQPVAGLIDPGETPVHAAHREADEEAGLRFSRLEDAGQAYSSPGSSTEFVYLYVGIADLGATQTHGGLSEEDEDIRSQVLSFDALMQALDSNQFHDLPLFSLALWLARHRDRLRLMA
ncbi:MAG: ADP-ribose pyrophosphatase [Paracoccaceae bacterium]